MIYRKNEKWKPKLSATPSLKDGSVQDEIELTYQVNPINSILKKARKGLSQRHTIMDPTATNLLNIFYCEGWKDASDERHKPVHYAI
jgi:hypothetical protein